MAGQQISSSAEIWGLLLGWKIGEHFWKFLSRSRPRFQELGSWDLCHSDLGIKKKCNLIS